MKKLISTILATTMLLPLNIGASASDISANYKAELATNSDGFITTDWNYVEYISVDEYIKKYGGEVNVNKAFNQAEVQHEAMLLKAEGKEEKAAALLNEKSTNNGENDLLLSLKEGKFLGLEIESISDLPPNNTNLSLRLKKENESSEKTEAASITEVSNELGTQSTSANKVYQGTHSIDGSPYKFYYTSQYANANELYEPESGSYFYKYGYSWNGDYRCTTDVTFSNNTKLYCGSQSVNMYVFIGATTSSAAVGGAHNIDFGLMANPSDSDRNQGLYAVRNIDGGSTFDVETYPKVNISGDSTNPMSLETKTVKLQLTIDTLGNLETVMYVNGSMIYYKTQSVTGFVSGNNASLTFFEAMSCVDPNGVNTNPTSGSYFTNVNFSNSMLYSYNDGERAFGTYGDDTYCVYICKPSDITYSFGTNSESVSIIYN